MLVKASCCQARGPEKRAGDFQTTLRKLRHDAEMLFASWFMSPAVREVYVAGGAGQGVIGCEEALPLASSNRPGRSISSSVTSGYSGSMLPSVQVVWVPPWANWKGRSEESGQGLRVGLPRGEVFRVLDV